MSNEIEVARIAADAAIRAARIQGEWTFAAGIVAFVGGLAALSGAYVAAARQVKLEERRYEARVAAYRFRIEVILGDLNGASAIHWGDASIALKTFRKDESVPVEMFLYPIPLADDLLEDRWEDHALLGQEVVRVIHDIRMKLRQYADFCDEVSAKKLRSTDVALWNGRAKDNVVTNPDGSVDIQMHNVVETNELLTREIRSSIERFRTALENQPRRWQCEFSDRLFSSRRKRRPMAR
jgi:hypothetical protein